jgi:hypothetical protein
MTAPGFVRPLTWLGLVDQYRLWCDPPRQARRAAFHRANPPRSCAW